MGYFFAGIYRLEILHSGQGLTYPTGQFKTTIIENDFWLNLNCTRVVFPYFLIARWASFGAPILGFLHHSYQLIGASTLTITIDRVIAVTVPLKYRTFTWRYAYGLVGCMLRKCVHQFSNYAYILGALAFVSMGFLVCVYFWFSLRSSTVSILCYTSTAYGPEVLLC